jgi:ABC-type multidrug transport system fused ATPase/permease subunit
LVLKGLTFDVKPGEKVGIIGRTGAGKSSIAQALFRTVELCEGKIEVDGRNLRSLGLEVVRSRLAIIPQDAFLFGGTVRENIDPTGARTDAELNDAMGLVHRSSSSSAALKEKFNLEGIVANEGSNFSAGERQLRKRILFDPFSADGQFRSCERSPEGVKSFFWMKPLHPSTQRRML